MESADTSSGHGGSSGSGAATTLCGPVALIRFRHPPVNSLGHAMRVGAHAELKRAIEDPSIKAVVLAGEGRGFCAGAQITEFSSGEIAAYPTAHDIWAMVEASPKPVVAAIRGYALGGGLEFAMACHYRIAAPDAKLAAPEVRLGLLPGAGGTQRLPRAVGVKRALQMMLEGERTPAGEFAGTLLVDRLADGDVVEAALDFAGTLIAERAPLRRLRDLPLSFPKAEAFFAAELERVASAWPGMFAPPAIARCVQAALSLPFEEGLRFERAKFQELVSNDQSKALRTAFFAGSRAGGR